LRENPRSFEDDTPTVELPAITAPLPPVHQAPSQQQVPAQPAPVPPQPRAGSWATPTEVDAVAVPISERRHPEPPAESDKERRRREMNQYRMSVWDRRFVACVRWLYARIGMAVYLTALVVLPGLLFPPVKAYLNWVMIANLTVVGFLAVSLVAGEVTSRAPQWSSMVGALSRMLVVGGFAIGCGYVSDADPWKEMLAPPLRALGPFGLQILSFLDYASLDHAIFMGLGLLLAHRSLRKLTQGGRVQLEGTSRFGTRPGWSLKAYYAGPDPRAQQGWADAPSIFAYRRKVARFYVSRFWVLLNSAYIIFLMFVIASA
jgi:membrane protein